MFSSGGLFKSLQCPERDSCTRTQCIFSHKDTSELPPAMKLVIPVNEPPQASSSASAQPSGSTKTIPAKRTVDSSPLRAPGSPISNEPPRKLQKVGPVQRSQAVPTVQTTPTGTPVLRVTAAASQVAVPVRQAMLKTIYEHFLVLYDSILPLSPSLASEHALKQEEEVYNKSNKFTYRNAVIQSVATLKRRDVPTSISHPSVGTEGDLAARAEAKRSISALHVTAAHLEPHVMSLDDMKKWGYVVEIPEGPGGSQPSKHGQPTKCERCGELFVVQRLGETDAGREACLHHWGRAYNRVVNGERIRAYNCCSKDVSDTGCVRATHVFYESDPLKLHLRHAFSWLESSSSSTILDVAALDCEMIYTTGGMRIARVSVVDGAASLIFDELVRMDDGVDILDFNTRFSGITPEMYAERALLPLASIRQSLNAYLGRETILIGHALENDLKTLRLIHHRCIDTVQLYPHPKGGTYRRSLRDLAREHLNTSIQEGGGSTGHSSLEDAIATLDLVRLYLINNAKPSKDAPASSTSNSVAYPLSRKSSFTAGSQPSSTTSSRSPGMRPSIGGVASFAKQSEVAKHGLS